ncbi:MAG: iron-containing alcohol dehydrogenase [Desulfobacterales bacterium]|nr:iron-containing alcohol dehydrogenase [Desulfobacterales bacterium]
MNPSFTYNLTPSIKFGCGLAAKIGEEIVPRCDEKRVVMISDPGVVGAGHTDMAAASLKKNGFTVDLFSDLTGEPSTMSLDTAAKLIRTARPSAVIGLGGGSALDVAKLATVLASADQGAEYYALTANPLPPKAANIALLPTTAGTGAEVTRTAVFTNSENRKVWAWGHELAADLVILDPELTLSLPESLTAATGLDAMVHAIEACTVKKSHPLTQSFGLHAIRLGIQNLEKAIEHPQDLGVRGKLLIASTLAGMAIDGAGTGLAHSIGHALGTIAGIHHGRAVTLALDVVFPKNAATAIEAHADIAVALGVQPGTESSEDLAKMGAQAFSDFIRRTGMAISLKQDGLCEDDLERFVDVIHSSENTSMSYNNCYAAGEEDIRKFARQLLSR